MRGKDLSFVKIARLTMVSSAAAVVLGYVGIRAHKAFQTGLGRLVIPYDDPGYDAWSLRDLKFIYLDEQRRDGIKADRAKAELISPVDQGKMSHGKEVS